MLAFAGPGYLVAVGYMDPGNWATDLAGGARYGYTLLSVIMLSNLMAILLQALAVRLGIASGRDLAQACRDSYSKPTTIVLWILCEIAIAACDLAEVIGAAIALNLLISCPGGRRGDHRCRRCWCCTCSTGASARSRRWSAG
jgi:manganese transport protein